MCESRLSHLNFVTSYQKFDNLTTVKVKYIGCLNCSQIFNMQTWAGRLDKKCMHLSYIQCQNASPHDAVYATVSVWEVQRYPAKWQLWHGMTLIDCVHNSICRQTRICLCSITVVLRKSILGRVPYKSAKEGAFSSVSTFNHVGAPMSCL